MNGDTEEGKEEGQRREKGGKEEGKRKENRKVAILREIGKYS